MKAAAKAKKIKEETKKIKGLFTRSESERDQRASNQESSPVSTQEDTAHRAASTRSVALSHRGGGVPPSSPDRGARDIGSGIGVPPEKTWDPCEQTDTCETVPSHSFGMRAVTRYRAYAQAKDKEIKEQGKNLKDWMTNTKQSSYCCTMCRSNFLSNSWFFLNK